MPRRKRPDGWVHSGHTNPDGTTTWHGPDAVAYNTRMYTWGYMACRTLGLQDTGYSISYAYVEYANLSTPGTPVAVPSVTRADDVSYFNTLAADPAKDVLRVPVVVSPQVGVVPGYEAFFTPGLGNLLTVIVQTVGTVGLYGKPFSASSNSTVYGVALVGAPVPSDRTRDVLFSRAYYQGTPVNKQVAKQASGQVSMSYSIPFG